MNVTDPYYVGALPSVGVFVLGLAIIYLAGWLYSRKEKR